VNCGLYNSADVGSSLLGYHAVFIGNLFLITLFLDPLDPEDGCSKLHRRVDNKLQIIRFYPRRPNMQFKYSLHTLFMSLST